MTRTLTLPDGIREIQFDAICYIPESSIPYFTEQYITNTDSELYDYYTGMWFTAATAYGNSQRGDNYYVHTVNYNGNEYLIEFAYSTDWQYNVSDNSNSPRPPRPQPVR